ncbi:NAD(P)-dependent oxidoreductase [Frigidibacter sp. MR17.14]|uniref:NAD(P)-dependent oxidoreductase n=1 Tax=Frigidibacter sp. MR17.14 TaxID=3126509 RepID=UPI003012FE61
MRVLVTEPVHPDTLVELAAAGHDVIDRPADLMAALAEAEAVLVRTMKLGADRIAAAPRLKIIAKHGAGVDNIDLAAAKAAGIAVTNTPGANSGSVAEQAMMLILGLARSLSAQRIAARPDPAIAIRDLEGRRLTVVGWGASAQKVARLAQAFGMAVTVVWPRRAGGATDEGLPVAASLAAVLPVTDVLSLHLPLSPATRDMIGAAELAALPAGAIVINTARGGLIDEVALADSLRAGHLGGAGLDVLAQEPIRADEPLRDVPNVMLTPHLAGMGDRGFRATGLMAAGAIGDYLAGRLDPAMTIVAPPAA